jgi:hypothetical protein
MRLPASFCALFLVLSMPVPVQAQLPAAKSWSEQKCERYTKAWTEALRRRGRKGLSERFLADHAAFLAAGCQEGGNVCPRSAEEFDLANIMVVAAMNAGMASTFPPFACRR